MTVAHFQTTQGGDQPPSAAPLWEARMNDSYTLSDHPEGRSTTFYSTAWGARMNDSYTLSDHPGGRSTTFYSTALGGQNA